MCALRVISNLYYHIFQSPKKTKCFIDYLFSSFNDFQTPENKVLYSLVKDDDSTWFNIDAASGIVTIKRRVSLDQDRPDQYRVRYYVVVYRCRQS